MNTILSFGLPGGPEIILLLGIPLFVLWLWALIDALKSDFTNSNNKLIWILVVVFLPLLGPILYLTIGRGQKVQS